MQGKHGRAQCREGQQVLPNLALQMDLWSLSLEVKI